MKSRSEGGVKMVGSYSSIQEIQLQTLQTSIQKPAEIAYRKTIYQVDSFTDIPFKGNPAGIMIVDKDCDEVWM